MLDPPALPDSYAVDEDVNLVVSAAEGVLENDGDVNSAVTTATLVTGPANGQLTLNSDGSFTYIPDADFFGEDSFTYRGSTGAEDTNVARVTINVLPVADPPTAVADDYALEEDGSLTVSAAGGVLANDVDPDSDTLTAVLASSPANGSLDFDQDGSFVYTPDADFFGEDSFTYAVSDGNTTSDSVTVTLTVQAVNDAPVADGDSYSVDEDGSLTVDAATGVLTNDSDVDSNITAELVATGLQRSVDAEQRRVVHLHARK